MSDKAQAERAGDPGGKVRHAPPAANEPALSPVLRLQRTAGNQAVSRLVNAGAGTPRARSFGTIQRHAEGEALPDGPALVDSLDLPPPIWDALSKAVMAWFGGASTPPPTPAKPTAGPGADASTATAEPKKPAPGGATGAVLEASTPKADSAEAVKPKPEVEKPAPVAVAPPIRAMSLAKAEEVLSKSFGKVKKIVPGEVQVLKDREATWAKYDEVCIAANLTNPSTGEKWKSGDSKKRSPGLDGFAWGGVAYVNGETRLTTATAHEILHNNADKGFRKAVGETFNEGATEYLAKKSLTESAVAIEASAYPKNVALTEKLVALVGEDKLVSAYFNGAATLTAAYEAKKGEGSWATLKAKADASAWSDAELLLKPSATKAETSAVGAAAAAVGAAVTGASTPPKE